jgi:hypothetical protein
MKILEKHLYHGAALMQIMEFPNFNSISSLNIQNAYLLNDKVALFTKYAKVKNQSHREHIFNFNKTNLKDLKLINKKNDELFIILVCIPDREICCLSYEEFKNLVKSRKKAKGEKEENYTVICKISKNEKIRVYVNQPNEKNTLIGEKLIARNEFPSKLFR